MSENTCIVSGAWTLSTHWWCRSHAWSRQWKLWHFI